MIGVFLRLKWRLQINGIKRTARTVVGALGLFAGGLALTAVIAVGVVAFFGLRYHWDPEARVRVTVIGVGALVLGWWILPLLTGGVDETVDPSRLMLLPLNRRQLRRGQIAAGLLGPAPLIGVLWTASLIVGMATGVAIAVPVVAAATSALALAVVGSRTFATSLALVSRTRRGADAASMLVAISGAGLFAAAQLIRFVEPESLDPLVDVLRWSPPGWAADAMLAARDRHFVDAAWRVVAVWAVVAVLGAWWSRGLDRLLTEPGSRGSGSIGVTSNPLPLFDGIRSRLPRTAGGASVAREVIYLARQPGRRVSLFTGSALGLVYLVAIVAQGSTSSPLLVLGAPIAMLFSVQYASNQFGVDSDTFWLEVVSTPPPAARWGGRWLLASVSVLVPVVLAGVATAWWSGGWLELLAVLLAMAIATPTVVSVGSVLSAFVAVPIPDSGNPFASRQSADAKGCVNGLVSLAFVAMIAVLVLPVEGALVWALRHQPLAALAVVAGDIALNLVLARAASNVATSTIIRREVEILEVLDHNANR